MARGVVGGRDCGAVVGNSQVWIWLVFGIFWRFNLVLWLGGSNYWLVILGVCFGDVFVVGGGVVGESGEGSKLGKRETRRVGEKPGEKTVGGSGFFQVGGVEPDGDGTIVEISTSIFAWN